MNIAVIPNSGMSSCLTVFWDKFLRTKSHNNIIHNQLFYREIDDFSNCIIKLEWIHMRNCVYRGE